VIDGHLADAKGVLNPRELDEVKENPMTTRRFPTRLTALALSMAALTFAPSASAQQSRSWDPIKATGLEGGGWTHPFRMPQQNVPTHWDMTNFPRTPHPSHATGMPPVGGPIHGTLPSSIGGHPSFQPGMMGGHPSFPPGMMGGHPSFPPGMVGGHPGFQPGMMGGHPSFPPGMGGHPTGMPVGIPSNAGPTDINFPITVNNTSVSDTVTIANPDIGAGPDGMTDSDVAPSGPVVAPVVTVPPSQSCQSQPAIDDMAPAAPNVEVPDGMLGVVVVNQTGRTLKVLTKFFDPSSGRWIARWNEAISPGQVVRLGATSIGTFFMRADMTDDNGAVVPVLEGNDAVFQSPRGPMGLRRANVIQQGTDLVATING
jgi:hypothetical protein